MKMMLKHYILIATFYLLEMALIEIKLLVTAIACDVLRVFSLAQNLGPILP